MVGSWLCGMVDSLYIDLSAAPRFACRLWFDCGGNVRKNKVQLNSLSVGRCFTLPREPGPAPEERPADGARIATPVLSAADAWRVTDLGEQGVSCASADGQDRTFPSETEVVEIPRQGFDKLAAR